MTVMQLNTCILWNWKWAGRDREHYTQDTHIIALPLKICQRGARVWHKRSKPYVVKCTDYSAKSPKIIWVNRNSVLLNQWQRTLRGSRHLVSPLGKIFCVKVHSWISVGMFYWSMPCGLQNALGQTINQLIVAISLQKRMDNFFV